MHKNYFKTAESNELFERWLSNYPLSMHPFDMDRWTHFVYSIVKNGEEFNSEILEDGLNTHNHNGNQQQITDFMNRFESMKAIYQLCKN